MPASSLRTGCSGATRTSAESWYSMRATSCCSGDEIRRLVLFGAGSGTDRPLGRPSIYVLDPTTEQHAITALRPRVRVVYDTDRVFVAEVLHR